MRIYLINDTSGEENWGCIATSYALKQMIRRRGGNIISSLSVSEMESPDRQINAPWIRRFERALVNSTESLPKGRHLIRTWSRNHLQVHWDRIFGIYDTVPETYGRYSHYVDLVQRGLILQEESKCIQDSDLVIINGEGSIYDRQRKGLMALFLAYISIKVFEKPCILVNHTADLSDPVTREIASHVYPMLDDVVFREQRSAAFCKMFLEQTEDKAASDAVFSLMSEMENSTLQLPGVDLGQDYICLGGSSIYFRDDRPHYDPTQAYEKLCVKLGKISPVVLVASCMKDRMLFEPLAAKLDLPLIGPDMPIHHAMQLLGRAALFFSGRWHPSIFAVMGGTPIITTSANTHKTQAIVEQLGLQQPTFDSLKLHESVNEIVDLSQQLVRSQDIRDLLLNRSKILSRRTWRNVRFMSNAR